MTDKIQQAETALKALVDAKAEMQERAARLEGERKALKHLVRRKDAEAIERDKALEWELSEIYVEDPDFEIWRATQELETLRAEALAEKLETERAERDLLEVATIDAWLHLNDLRTQITEAIDAYDAARKALLACEGRLREMGENLIGWALPAQSDAEQAAILKTRRDELWYNHPRQ